MNKLAIVGSHPKTREHAPWDDDTYDIWVFNEAAHASWCKRWSACFQMHQPDIYRGINTKDPHHWPWLQENHDKPIYMQAKDELVPDCRVYPLDELVQKTGIKYFSATVCYALALAWHLGYGRVEVFGVELETQSEYISQADAFRFWVGFLKGAGIDVVLHSGSRLFEGKLYGYDSFPMLGSRYFSERAAAAEEQKKTAEKVYTAAKTALLMVLNKQDFAKFPEMLNKAKKMALYYGKCAGAVDEAIYHQGLGDRQADRQEFERRINLAQQGKVDFQGGEQLYVSLNRTDGILDYVFNQVKTGPTDDHLCRHLTDLTENLISQAYDLGFREGMAAENKVYMAEFDRRENP